MAAPLKLLIGPLIFKRPQSLACSFLDQTRYIHQPRICMPTTRADRAECTAGGATSYLVSYLCDKQCSPHFKPVFFLFSSFKHSHYSFSQVTWKLISSTCSVAFHLYPPLLALKMRLSRFNTAFPHTSLPYTVILWGKKKEKCSICCQAAVAFIY